jgi:hypothetical protein
MRGGKRMRVLATYLFKMYRPGHRVFRYKTFLCWDQQEAMEEADEWADCNGYVDYELIKEDRT